VALVVAKLPLGYVPASAIRACRYIGVESVPFVWLSRIFVQFVAAVWVR
jgi:hypothetical protein